MIFVTWCFLYYSFKLQLNVYNRCHDLLMMAMKLIDIAILHIKVSDYHSIVRLINKIEAINVIQNADLTEQL